MTQQKDRNQKNFTLSDKQLAAFDQLKSKLEFEKDIKLFDYMLTATERQNAIVIAPGREDEVNDFNHYLNAISKSYNSILESAINARSQAEADVARVLETREKTIANLQDQLKSAQEAQADAEKIAKETRESCDEQLTQERESCEAQLTQEREKQERELKSLKDSSTQQINSLQAELDATKTDCANKDKLVESQTGEIASLKEQVADKEAMAKTAETFEKMYKDLQIVLDDYRDQTKKLEDDLAEKNVEVADLQDKLEDKEKENTELKAKLKKQNQASEKK